MNKSLDLTKIVVGQKLDLTKQVAESGEGVLTKILVGCGWDPNASADDTFDADLSVVFAESPTKARMEDVIYFKKLELPYAKHSGDNLTGEGDGDDESVTIDLAAVPAHVTRCDIYVNIFGAPANGQNFGMLDNSYVRVDNAATGTKLALFDLNFDASTASAVLFASFIRRGDSWYMSGENKVVEGGTLPSIISAYGIATNPPA